MMMRLWGRKSSINVQKVLWCLAELNLVEGRDFERIDAGLHFGKNRTTEFLKLNPNGLVPTLEDDKFVLWESNTIMRYLTQQYDKAQRFSADLETRQYSEQWLDWQLGSMWPTLRVAFVGLTRTPEDQRNYAVIEKSYQDTNQLLALLDQNLATRTYCAGSQFQICDIAVALCVSRWILLNVHFPEKTGPRLPLKNIDAWMNRVETETKYSVVAEKELNILK